MAPNPRRIYFIVCENQVMPEQSASNARTWPFRDCQIIIFSSKNREKNGICLHIPIFMSDCHKSVCVCVFVCV